MADTVSVFEELLPEVTLEIPQITDPQGMMYLRRALRDFCVDSEAWRDELNDIDLVEDQQEYILPVGWDAKVHRILWVKRKTSSSDAFEDLDAYDEDRYELVDDSKINFIHSSYAPASDITDGMRVKAVLRSAINAEDIPYWMVDRWGLGIANRAKAMIVALPNRPYSNPGQYPYYQSLYWDIVSNAKESIRNENKNPKGMRG